jgi:hypothetical protein
MKPMTVVIDTETKEAIKALIEKASKNYTPLKTMKEYALNGVALPKNYNDEYTMFVPMGYVVTYTHEEQIGNVMCRHISISSTNESSVTIEAVQFIMAQFGFINSVLDTAFWVEDCRCGNKAINLLEPLDGNMEKIKKKK